MTLFVKLTQVEKDLAALPVLLAARRAVVLDGAEPIAAIQEAGRAEVECHYARQLLERVLGLQLYGWQTSPKTLQSDRTRAFDRAIRLARRAQGHRGGWCVAAVAT